ncbi:MAG: valine--tRNA ligase [Deltaproteobacteria bacterium]|nr:valine--tRNA ligase [Deltaproteobacteria bacterium]
MDLSKTFEPRSAEEHWFQLWIDRGYFKADPSRPGPIFSIVIPPPNVTGALHLGHALNNTLHDVIVRTRRMQGYNTLWVPGTDHAGIATQNVVERELAKEGKTRHDLGREKFVERVWQWRETYGGKILHQLRRLGCSCDWSRERFTLDEGLSRAVTKVFVGLYNEGLIERDYRLINWCPRCETALSDLEVDHKETAGNLWYIRYPLTDGSGVVTVATTRPETMLGDSGVAVHPEDARYKHLVGRSVRLPLVGREIPIIADAAVDREFGTGAVKITPGHDFSDFEIGRRHGLAQISVMDARARMNAEAGPYAGMPREACRQRVVADMTAQQLIEKVEPHRHALGVCSRCDTAVEPMLSYQWFMRVRKPDAGGQSIAGRAIAAVEQGATRFFPQQWENTYFAWMRNIQDWCISRQLWWGHRIPAWWCERCAEAGPIVAETRPSGCPRCGGGDLRQDDDVLDTWFSSGLWPFTTLGWPERTADLETYYPTTLLITAFDIIFFWVARMMMFGLKVNPLDADSLAGAVPFKHVYITPLVRDAQGKKMTKSRGNVVDPLEIMQKYGTDAVRFTLAQLTVQGRDLVLSDERLAASRAFANKIWNAARFVLMNLEGAPQPLQQVELSRLSLADRWILSRLDAAIRTVGAAIDAYEFNLAALTVYQFIWHEFCDRYIELSKEALKSGGDKQAAARHVLVHCFDQLLRLLHPFMPFISEEIWQAVRPYLNEANLSEHLTVATWPEPAGQQLLSEAEAAAMERCITTTQVINSLRSLVGHHPGRRIKIVLRPNDNRTLDIAAWKAYAMTLAKISELQIERADADRSESLVFAPLIDSNSAAGVTPVTWGEVGIETPADFDSRKARDMLQKRLDEVRVHLHRNQSRYDNPEFRSKAGEETVDEIAERIEQLKAQESLLQSQIALIQ